MAKIPKQKTRTKKHCLQCKKYYIKKDTEKMGRFNNKKFCSLDCAYENKKKGTYTKCLVCGNEFWCRPSKLGKQKTCSIKCGIKIRKPKPKKGKAVKCICGKQVYRLPGHITKHSKAYCSKECAHKGQLTNKPKTCKTCGEEYYRPISQVRLRGSSYCSVKCRGIDQAKIYKKKRHDKTKYPNKIATFKRFVWKRFSVYIRERDNWTCFTCGKKAEGKSMHAGHFIPRTYSATLFDEMNVNAQCYSCNIWKRGNAGEYSIRLIERYGKKKVEELVEKSRKVHKITYDELIELYERYKLPKAQQSSRHKT